ncbi:hypothetical protein [Streptomyces sp. TBY4]|uniref:hypothetical protein n=1 Tax=Streptomyces sp. TBY4 TaxID=2962030 RepID=UPI0020B802A3|nr:hypothetical protein [Streptomyces sp. TBY4]MCP3759692.1 hypothetical protein [Streptomyces sp. TBY4]
MIPGFHRMKGGAVLRGAQGPGEKGPFGMYGGLPERMRLIWIGDAEDGSGRRQVFSDTISTCTWTSPRSWDTSGRLLVCSAVGREAPCVEPLEPGVVIRDHAGWELLRTLCGHLLHLDGTGNARIDTPDGMRGVALVGVFFVHDPERTTAG